MPTYINVYCVWVDGDEFCPGYAESLSVIDGGFDKSFELEDLLAQGCDPEFWL